MGFGRASDLGSYLGVSLFHQRVTKRLFSLLLIALAKSVGVCKKIETVTRNFVWGSRNGEKKTALVN